MAEETLEHGHLAAQGAVVKEVTQQIQAELELLTLVVAVAAGGRVI